MTKYKAGRPIKSIRRLAEILDKEPRIYCWGRLIRSSLVRWMPFKSVLAGMKARAFRPAIEVKEDERTD